VCRTSSCRRASSGSGEELAKDGGGRLARSKAHGVPDLARDSGPCVGGESCAAVGIVPLQSLPEADASGVQELLVGEGATPLAAEHGVDKAIMLGRQGVQGRRGAPQFCGEFWW